MPRQTGGGGNEGGMRGAENGLDNERGFTLIELLVALVITLMALDLLYAGYLPTRCARHR